MRINAYGPEHQDLAVPGVLFSIEDFAFFEMTFA